MSNDVSWDETVDGILDEFAKRDPAGYIVWGTKISKAYRQEVRNRENEARASKDLTDALDLQVKRLTTENASLRAAFAKVESVVAIQYAKRNLGDKGRMAVAEIMSACRFPDGALDEFRRTFAENARLRAALKPVPSEK